ncbi:MAG: hypothetical protein AAF628_25805 [Planctomycetota bacterium]
MQTNSTMTAVSAALALTLSGLAHGQRTYGTHSGQPCGTQPTLTQAGAAYPGGSVHLDLQSSVPTAPASIVLIGTSKFEPPLPYGGCLIHVLPLASLIVPVDPVTGQGSLSLGVPATILTNVDLEFQSIDLGTSGILGGSDRLTVTVDATPPSITGVSASSGAFGTRLVLSGSFDQAYFDYCVAPPFGLGVIESGTATQLVVEVQPSAGGSGPLDILEGERDQLPASSFIPIPGAPSPSAMTVFSGSPLPATMSSSRQTVRITPTPGFTRLGSSSSTTGGAITHDFDEGCKKDDCLRVWMRIYENGNCHDVYFTEDGSYVGKTLTIPADMPGNLCAIWACSWLTASLAPRIPGFVCNVDGDSITMEVTVGTGITGHDGGFWIDSDC